MTGVFSGGPEVAPQDSLASVPIRSPGCGPRLAAERSYWSLVMGKDGKDAHRVSVTLTRAQHAKLERIANKYGVKVSWLVRRAAERLIDQEQGGPLLPLDFGGRDEKR